MTDEAALWNEEAAALAAIEGMSVTQMIGELLAAAAHHFTRRRGGPGAIRCLLAILAAFVTVIMTLAVRQRANMVRHVPAAAAKALRHLRCPPSRWAGA